MNQFISWIEHDGKNYFLTKNELSTDRGKKLIAYCGNDDDLVGHGAIRWYYKFKGGLNRECMDFTDPKRFPPEIVQALKDGLFEGMGVAPEILTEEALVKFCKTERKAKEKYIKRNLPAWKEYNKTKWQVDDVHNEVKQQAWEKYNKMTRQAQEECRKVAQQAFWALFKDPNNRTEVWR